MINSGKCPKCERPVTHVNMETVDIHQNLQKAWHGVYFLCPSCRSILGAGMDPVALKTDTVNAVLAALKRK
jgi:hypothetical protein